MYADVSDYAELRYKTASTGLIFSTGSMSQKFGCAIGGSAIMWLLGACGYSPDNAVQPASAINCLWWLMSFVPAMVAALSLLVACFYPLTTKRVEEINRELTAIRKEGGGPSSTFFSLIISHSSFLSVK